jgi:hypothetical protein
MEGGNSTSGRQCLFRLLDVKGLDVEDDRMQYRQLKGDNYPCLQKIQNKKKRHVK